MIINEISIQAIGINFFFWLKYCYRKYPLDYKINRSYTIQLKLVTNNRYYYSESYNRFLIESANNTFYLDPSFCERFYIDNKIIFDVNNNFNNILSDYRNSLTDKLNKLLLKV